MTKDSQVLILHDKATRGMKLSADELQELQQWYDAMDQEESLLLT